ncbi:MAG: alpha/beta fold hydrolase [Nocardioidaceae bacterium]|nr:MAG: alpha/beta fold hydrolase [Nocardioidaceae bacterium]
MRSSARVIASVLVMALIVGVFAWLAFRGDGLEPKPIDGGPDLDGVPVELHPFYTQKLTWTKCQDSFECASVDVPLDYADPTGRTITLQLLKAAASSKKVGSLVVNPGGPGGSGIEYAMGGKAYWGKPLRDHFDIVGFDPRGVASSDPLTCVNDAQLDRILASDPTPDTPAEVAADRLLSRQFFAGCMRRDAELATHMSTEEAARDMDVIRSVLGEGRMTYFGASYGTFLGGMYADLFPQRVGRMVLDGAIDPSQSTVDSSLTQARGFEVALRAYLADCVAKGDCYLGDTVEAGAARVQEFFSELDAEPLVVGDRELTEGLGLYGVITPLYNQDYWEILDAALGAALEGHGLQLLALADAYTRRGLDGFLGNAFQVLPVVNCTDYNEPISTVRARKLEPRFLEASPTFGRMFVSDLTSCSTWTFQSGRRGAELRALGAAPILVVGTTRDPATPLEWAEALAADLESGVLLTRDGDGHTGYNAGNACTDQAIESYLVEGKVPADDTRC